MVDPIRGLNKYSILLIPRTAKGNALFALGIFGLGIIWGLLCLGWFGPLLFWPCASGLLRLALSPKFLEKHNKECDKYWGDVKSNTVSTGGLYNKNSSEK